VGYSGSMVNTGVDGLTSAFCTVCTIIVNLQGYIWNCGGDIFNTGIFLSFTVEIFLLMYPFRILYFVGFYILVLDG
jgi:hypothetical protein